MNLDLYCSPLTLYAYVWILHRLTVEGSHQSALVLCKDDRDGAVCSPRLFSELIFLECLNLVLLCINFIEQMIPWEGPTAVGECYILY